MRAPESILIVSPDVTTLQGLTRALMVTGMPVVPALGWSEGEFRLHRIPVSLVVADIEALNLAERTRIERLRAEVPHVAIVMLVSFCTPEARAAEREGLVLAVLEKPVALGRLEATARAALSQGAAR
jgi:DNA-binding NtrC family response regulator